ncbi:dimethylaniline monooxygenase [N-oxide-forming] 2-like isoform X2 [Rhinatrema bivittatum]|uniref:dimethylaniline monooxygenase [N-oxide-forming] 2-like isoform X2 n=1 Tax=Rhinatrema bivittatum TaxID=194408 RepID=UPI00112956EE|nr:dimethylaniline monooxygenase [N-oxide-forming] 2-like isoform X2 [Rhinatrema bivittatum]
MSFASCYKDIMVTTVAVIGAGASGLTAIKCCLDEGLEPTCFEGSDDIGGLWRYTEEVDAGRPSIYRSVVTNGCKEMMCFSDFPIPDHFPNYLSHFKVMEYYRLYAEHFNLLQYIRFKTRVCSVRRCPDFSTTGQWLIVTEANGRQESAVFDAVLVCTGHFTKPYLPLELFPGIGTFKGQYFHSREYKTPRTEFHGKRILVVGLGNSAADIATELSYVADQVFLSTRRGVLVISRIFGFGYPWDAIYISRIKSWLRDLLPASIEMWMVHRAVNKWFDHAAYGLEIQKSLEWKEPIANEELPSRIACGTVVIKAGVKEFTETSAIFEDGTIEENIDGVIFATGYSLSFPFLDESVLKVENNRIFLYKNMFPPCLEKPTLAAIGLVQPVGSLAPISELQARWATRVFKGLNQLPSMGEQLEEINKVTELLIKRFGRNRACSLLVNNIAYLDEIASEIGAKPSIPRLFLADPKLALHVLFGPCLPSQYRLTGPGKWDGARRTILTTWDRIFKPTRTRVVNNAPQHSISMLLGFLCFAILFAGVLIIN